MIPPLSFYDRKTIALAKQLLGSFLAFRSDGIQLIGRIVETEAYLFRNDPGCHAHKGKTQRNAVMFGPAGRSYVYLIYGMYHCLNVVSGKLNEGEAVLIRALEPVKGIEHMRENRQKSDVVELCNGPGKLTQAFGLTRDHNDLCLRTSDLRIHARDSYASLYRRARRFSTVETTRIGLSAGKELPYRFFIKDCQFVSRVK